MSNADFVLRIIGIVIYASLSAYYIVLNVKIFKNKCFQRTFKSIAALFLVNCVIHTLLFASDFVFSDKSNYFIIIAYILASVGSTCFLIGFWLFSCRYYITSNDLNYLYKAICYDTLKRIDSYNIMSNYGIAISVLLGPFQYSDYAQLTAINKLDLITSIKIQVILLGATAILNAVFQILLIVVTINSIFNIGKFIGLHPESKMNKQATSTHFGILLISLVMQISIIGLIISYILKSKNSRPIETTIDISIMILSICQSLMVLFIGVVMWTANEKCVVRS